jgi:hypothetical protein
MTDNLPQNSRATAAESLDIMASSTARLRKSSRVSSPAPKVAKEPPALDAEEADPKKKTFMDKWVEPPLRSPVPSYQDYGVEKVGVLEQMRPLGQMPPQKAHAQVKRLIHLKNGNLSSSTKEVPAPTAESTGSTGSRGEESSLPESTRSQTPPAPSTPAPEKGAARPPSKIFPVKPANTRLSIPTGVAATKDQQRLARIMEQAIDRANSVGDETMALALKKLFRDSFNDERLYKILETTLSPGTQTEAEQKVFQSYVKEARHLFKKARSHSSSAHKSSRSDVQASTSPSKSPSKTQRSGAASGTRNMVNKAEATTIFTPAITANTSRSSTPTPRARRSEINGVKEVPHDPAKLEPDSNQRASRSKSNSSAVSSLTSMGSSEMEASGAVRPPSASAEGHLAQPKQNASRPEKPASSQPAPSSPSSSTDHHHQGSTSHTSPGPKLHTFMTTSTKTNGHVKHPKSKSTSSLKRDSTAAELDEDSGDAEVVIKRKKYERTFEDASIHGSALRGSLVEVRIPAKQSAGAKPSSAHLKNSNANGLHLDSIHGKRKTRDDDDALVSATSSAFGDHPPQSLSRPETPTLGRPSKKPKKAPRVKTS